jgi:hypothetical protein
MPGSPIQATPGGVTIRVFVAPRSPANKVVGEHNGAIKVALTAAPVEGAANKSLLQFLAKLLGVPRSSVTLVSGETSRQKLVRVLGVSVEQAMENLTVAETARAPRTPTVRQER